MPKELEERDSALASPQSKTASDGEGSRWQRALPWPNQNYQQPRQVG